MIILFFFFFNDTATTEIYTLSLHDALPICLLRFSSADVSIDDYLPDPESNIDFGGPSQINAGNVASALDRKSTRLNSSHANISYAVFCLKKKKNRNTHSSTISKPLYNSFIS